MEIKIGTMVRVYAIGDMWLVGWLPPQIGVGIIVSNSEDDSGYHQVYFRGTMKEQYIADEAVWYFSIKDKK